VLALTLALVGPYFIDWTNYRAEFEREASAILGRKVTVEGSAKARILPFPSVTFTDVTVGEGPVPVVTVEEFSMDAELAPLMGGEFLIFDMRVVRPRVNLAMDANGRLDWALSPSGPFNPGNVTLEKVTVTEGRIAIRDAANDREHLISEINTDISARSLRGPWRIDGTMRLDGLRTALSVSTGTIEESGAIRVRVRAQPAIYSVTLESDGDITLTDGKPEYEGTFKATENVEKTAELRGTDGQIVKTTETKPVPAYRVNGAFALSSERLDIGEYRLETGPLDDPYTADGKAYIDLGAAPRFAIEADGAQVRFDEALDVGAQGAGLTLTDRALAIHNALIDFPRPAIPGTIDIDLPAVVAGDTTIRDVKMSAEPAETGWQINTMSAVLPGRATIEGQGLLRTGETDFGFSGSMLLAIAQPSGFAAWLSKDVDDAIRRLPAAGFNAKVEMTPTRQSFRDAELILGTAKFRGELDNRNDPDTRPSLTLKLDGDALDVDGMAAFASLFVSDQGAARFADRDVDIDVQAGPVTASGLTADSVDTRLRFRGGTLEIDKLSIAGLAGASVSATGSLKDFTKSPAGNFDASIVAPDLAPLFSLLGAQYPKNQIIAGINRRAMAYPGLFEDTRFDMDVTAVKNDDATTGLALSAKGVSGGTNFTVSGSGNGDVNALETADFKLTVSADGPDAGALMALYGLRALPLGVAGQGQTTLMAEGSLADGIATIADITGTDAQAGFDGFISSDEGKLAARGSLRVEAADIEPWLMTSGVSIPGMGLGLPVSLTAYADLTNGVLALSDIEGEVADGPVAANISAELKEGVPHFTGNLSLDAMDLAQAAAAVLGEAALDYQDGYLSDTPFAPNAVPPFTAELELDALSLAAGPFGVLDNARMEVRVEKDGLKLSDLKGEAFGGTLSGLMEIKNSGGNALFSTQLKLAGANINTLLGATSFGGKTDVTASLTANGKSASGLIASLAGSGTATAKEIVVPGINPFALPTLITEADRIGRDIDAAKTAGFARAIVGNGTFAAPAGDIAFTVAGGILRAPPITLQNQNAAMTAEIRFDANESTVAADGSITYVPGDDALVGSEPVVGYQLSGPLGETTLAFNTEPLAQFLTQRALEKEQERVEALQASLLEKQRLRREVRYYAALQTERDAAAEALRRAEEEARIAAEAEAKRKAEEDARKAAEEAARLEAERVRAEEEARKAAEEAARLKVEAEAKARAEEEARKAAEAARLQAEADAKAKADAAQRTSEEAARLQAEADAKAKAQDEARKAMEEAARISAREETQRLEAEAAAKAAADERRQAEDAAERSAPNQRRINFNDLPGVENPARVGKKPSADATEPLPRDDSGPLGLGILKLLRPDPN